MICTIKALIFNLKQILQLTRWAKLSKHKKRSKGQSSLSIQAEHQHYLKPVWAFGALLFKHWHLFLATTHDSALIANEVWFVLNILHAYRDGPEQPDSHLSDMLQQLTSVNSARPSERDFIRQGMGDGLMCF